MFEPDLVQESPMKILAAIVVSSLFVSGCALNKPDPQVVPPTHLVRLDQPDVVSAITECRLVRDQNACRQEVAFKLKALYDQAYQDRVRIIVGGMTQPPKKSPATFAPQATSVLAVAATALVGDDRHKAYIQIGQDFVGGFAGLLRVRGSPSKLTPRERVYRMDASRTEVWSKVRLGLVEPVSRYTLDAVIADMGEYDSVGTPEAAEL